MSRKTDKQQFPFVRELLDLAAQEASGRLVAVGSDGDHGWVWLRDGYVSGVSAPTRTPLLANRLIAFELLSPSQLRNALDAATEAPGTRLIDVLLRERSVPEVFLHDFATRTAAERLSAILRPGVAETLFENGRVHRAGRLLLRARDVIDLVDVGEEQPLSDARLLAVDSAAAAATQPIERAILRECDGGVDTQTIADRCGLTIRETVELVAPLVAKGLILALEPKEADAASPDPPTPAAPASPSPAAPGPADSVPTARTAGDRHDPARKTDEVGAVGDHSPSAGPQLREIAAQLEAGAVAATQPVETARTVAAPPMSPSSLDRRDAASMLAALSVASDSTRQQPDARPDPTPTATPQDEPPAAEATPSSPGAKRPRFAAPSARGSADPAITSQAFQELRSLGQPLAETPSRAAKPRPETKPAPDSKEPESRRRRFFGK